MTQAHQPPHPPVLMMLLAGWHELFPVWSDGTVSLVVTLSVQEHMAATGTSVHALCMCLLQDTYLML